MTFPVLSHAIKNYVRTFILVTVRFLLGKGWRELKPNPECPFTCRAKQHHLGRLCGISNQIRGCPRETEALRGGKSRGAAGPDQLHRCCPGKHRKQVPVWKILERELVAPERDTACPHAWLPHGHDLTDAVVGGGGTGVLGPGPLGTDAAPAPKQPFLLFLGPMGLLVSVGHGAPWLLRSQRLVCNLHTFLALRRTGVSVSKTP